MKWDEREFEKLYEIPSKNGLTRPSRVRGSGYKMINMGELFAYDRIGDIDMELVPMQENELQTMLVEPGDLLFARQSMVLSGAGKCSIIMQAGEPTTFESHIIRVRLNRETADPFYYFYYFKSPISRIRSIVTQGVQAGIRGNDLKKLAVHVPPIDEQHRIASILSAYDDLIENNRRRIQLLEQSARLLYKEWFVHLRFPGHERVKVVDGVPEGWGKGVVSDFFPTASGGTPSRKNPDFYTGVIPWVKTQELTGGFILSTEERITEEAIKLSSAKLFPRHTVLVAMYGATIGQTAILSVPATTNQACCAVIPAMHEKTYAYTYLFFDHYKTDFIGLGQGAAQKNISQQVIKAFKMVLPAKRLLDAFSETVCPLFDQIETLQRTNINLIQARDLLLPRLMNGELTV